MRKALLSAAVAACFAAVPSFAQDAVSDADSVLRAIYMRDQKVRERIMEHYAAGRIDSIARCSEEMEMADAENRRTVFAILDGGGWPEGLSREANSAIFLVIDHAEPESQKRYYRFVADAAKNGVIGRSLQVTLRDRILMHDGKRQCWGTQTVSFTRDSSVECYMWPVANPRGVDRRRRKAGLPPIAEYMDMVGKTIGTEVVWDRSLSVADLGAKGGGYGGDASARAKKRGK